MMKKRILLLCCLSLMSINLNAEDVVGLEENMNISKVSHKVESRKDDDVQFALELGAKTDFWNPGLPKEEGGEELLKYDTEGLYLGYATFKTKIYGTDVLTFEKFGTLKSSDNQDQLLEQYKDNRKKDTSFQGYKASIEIMKIVNYLFDTKILEGLGYQYTNRNFISTAMANKDSVYWFGSNPGLITQDYINLTKGNKISFATTFRNHELFYKFRKYRHEFLNSKVDSSNKDSQYFMFGFFDKEWEKPTYLGTYYNSNPLIFDATYKSRGILLGLGIESSSFDVELKYSKGLNDDIQLSNLGSANNYINGKTSMDEVEFSLLKRFPDIYTSNYYDIDLILNGNALYTDIKQETSSNQKGVDVDAETIYSVGVSFEIIF